MEEIEKREDQEVFVPVPIDKYEVLIREDTQLRALINVLIGTSSLSYDGKRLQYNDDAVTATLNTMVPDAVKYQIGDLQAEKDKERQALKDFEAREKARLESPE